MEGIIPLSYYNDILKILNLPRFYRRFKINILEFGKRFGSANVRLVKFIINLELYVHIIGCIWYFVARLYDFDHRTWVYNQDLIGKEKEELYLFSVYWCLSTLATVGFGDIRAYNNLERVVSIIWMMIGVVSYSYTVGSLSTMILEFNYKTYRMQQS